MTNKPSLLVDYTSIYSNYSGLSGNNLKPGNGLINSSQRTDDELEKLITEKLNQRYNQKKKQLQITKGNSSKGEGTNSSGDSETNIEQNINLINVPLKNTTQRAESLSINGPFNPVSYVTTEATG